MCSFLIVHIFLMVSCFIISRFKKALPTRQSTDHVATQLLISDSSVNFCLLTTLSDRWNTVFIQVFHLICSSFMKQEMCLSSAGMLSQFALTVITLLFTENGSSQRFFCHKQAFQHLAFLAYAFDGDLFTTSKT